MLKSFCIGHIPTLFSPPIPFTFLSSQPLGLQNEVLISDSRFGTSIDGGSLAEYSQLFGLAELIRSGDVATDRLHLFQYRKFISPRYIHPDNSEDWASRISPDVADTLFPSEGDLSNSTFQLLIGSEFALSRSISKDYADAHESEDFIQFLVACHSCGVLNYDDIRQITSMRRIIYSPALCIIESAIFLSLIEKLNKCWKEYSLNFHTQRIDYQRRVSGYLLERLHSYLIYKSMIQRDITETGIWKRYIVIV
jgi:hypothetical protein